MIERKFLLPDQENTRARRYPTQIISSETSITWSEVTRSNVSTVVVLEAPSGAGKTHFLQRLEGSDKRYIYHEAVRWLENPLPAERLPIIDGLDELAFQNRAKKQALLEMLRLWLERKPATPGLQAIIATRLGTWSDEDSRIIKGTTDHRIRRVHLAHLDSDDVQIFARDLGIDNPEDFALRGPGSLCGLYPYEVQIFARTRTDFSGPWQATARALLEASFASTERHVQTLTLTKWSLGLCRIAAAACLMGRRSFALDTNALHPEALQAWRLLHDYTPTEQREMFSSSFFGHKASSLYQLREGKLTFLLAALWCAERLIRGADPEACRLWANDPTTGHRHVPIRLRALLGWIGSSVQYLQKSLTRETPDIWLWGGDFAYISNSDSTALRAYQKMLEVANKENFLPNVEDAQLHALAPYVAPHILVSDTVPLSILRLNFRIRAAANALTAPEILAFLPTLFRPSPFGAQEFHTSSAVIVLKALGKLAPDDGKKLRAWADGSKPGSLRLFLQLGLRPNTLSETTSHLIDNREIFTSNGRSENFLSFIVDKLVEVELPQLFKYLSTTPHLPDERYTLLPYLAERMIERQLISDWDSLADLLVEIQRHWQFSMHEFTRPGMFDTDKKGRAFPGGTIRKILENDAVLREVFWKRHVTLVTSTPAAFNPTAKLLFVDVERRDLAYLASYLAMMPECLLRESIAKAQSEAAGEAAAANTANTHLIVYLTENPAAALQSMLVKQCKNDYWWVSYNPKLIEKMYGPAIMPHLKIAVGKVWRAFAGPLKTAPKPGDTDLDDLGVPTPTEKCSDIEVYLAAIDLEVQLSERLELSCDEVVIALNIASWAERAFPSWMWNIQSSSPEAAEVIKATLMAAVEKLWDQHDASPWLFKHTLLGVMGPTLGSIIAQLLEQRPPSCREISFEVVWLLRYVDEPMQVRRVIARRESDMPEVSRMWIELLADLNWGQAEARIVRLLEAGVGFDQLPRCLDAVLRERPESLQPRTLFLVAQRLYEERLKATTGGSPEVIRHSAWHGCIQGLMDNEVDDPRHYLKQIGDLHFEPDSDLAVEAWMTARAQNSWASNACLFADEEQILTIERGDECRPVILQDLWRLVQRHISVVTEEAESGDFSCVQLFSTVEKYRDSLRVKRDKTDPRRWEFLVQLWFAEQLRLISRGLYHIAREEEVYINSERIDISACSGNLRVPIEIKLIDYSLESLEQTVRMQLLERYMKPPGVRFGILLVVKTHPKSYQNRGPLLLVQVIDHLQIYANNLLEGIDKAILVRGIDLTAPPSHRPSPSAKKASKTRAKVATKRAKSSSRSRKNASAARSRSIR